MFGGDNMVVCWALPEYSMVNSAPRVVHQGIMYYGMVYWKDGAIYYGMLWAGTFFVLHSMVYTYWYTIVWYGLGWFGTVWYSMVRCSMEAADFPLPTSHCSHSSHRRNGIPVSSSNNPRLFPPLKVLSARTRMECSEISKFVNGIFYVGLALPSAGCSYFQ